MNDVHDPPDLSRPPGPPELPRRFQLYRAQWIGIPLLMLVPVLAILDVFGESRNVARSPGGGIELEVDYPTRMRFGQETHVAVRVLNTSAAPLDVTVTADPGYIEAFSKLSFTPEPSTSYTFELVGVAPGEERRMRIEMAGERYWRQTGEITAAAQGPTRARVAVSTFVFP